MCCENNLHYREIVVDFEKNIEVFPAADFDCSVVGANPATLLGLPDNLLLALRELLRLPHRLSIYPYDLPTKEEAIELYRRLFG
jgi:hypothetical protein